VARAATPRAAEPGAPAAARGTGWAAALGFVAAASGVVLAMYLAHELIERFVFPVGPDGPVYTWWTRYADALGLDVARGRPGIPAATLVLGTALGTEPAQTVMLLGPLLATAAGLAAAALVETALGPDRVRAFIAAVLTGAFAAYLAGGWLANMGQAALFLGGVAALAAAPVSWRGVWAGSALLAAAGITHPLFHLVGLAVLAGAVLAFLPAAVRDHRAGGRLADSVAARVGLGALGGTAAAGLGLLAVAGAPAIPGDTSQDGFFRRAGLTDLLRDRYAERFVGDASRAAIPLAVGAALAAPAVTGEAPPLARQGVAGGRFLAAILTTWAGLTVAGTPVLLVTQWGPANRLLVFAFFVPIAAAVGAAAVMARGRALLTVAVVLGVAAFAATSMNGWYRQAPSFAPEELARATDAGRAVEGLPSGTPVIFLVDTSEPAAAFHVTRFGNVIRMGLPPERIPDSYLVVGSPGDFLGGRPTITGDPEHDRIARVYFRQASTVSDRAAVLVLDLFNPEGYEEAAARGNEIAPGVMLLRGPEAVETPTPATDVQLGGVELVVLSAAALILLATLGLGWARWALHGAGLGAAAALSSAAGLGLVVIAGFVVDRLVAGAAAPWGLPAAVALALSGYVAAARGRRNRG
jgi:hypothetical protein